MSRPQDFEDSAKHIFNGISRFAGLALLVYSTIKYGVENTPTEFYLAVIALIAAPEAKAVQDRERKRHRADSDLEDRT